MPFDYERFNKVAGGIQSVVIALAVIIGGVWTIFTFSYLGTAEKEKAEVEKVKAELFKQSVVDVEVEAKQEVMKNTRGFYIAANVKLTNKGNRNTYLSFIEPSLRIIRVNFDESGVSTLGKGFEQLNLVSQDLVLRYGASVKYPFLVRVAEKGFYLISFEARLDGGDLQIYREGGGQIEKSVWAGRTYILVQ